MCTKHGNRGSCTSSVGAHSGAVGCLSKNSICGPARPKLKMPLRVAVTLRDSTKYDGASRVVNSLNVCAASFGGNGLGVKASQCTSHSLTSVLLARVRGSVHSDCGLP